MILVISSKKVYAVKRILQEAEIRNEKLEIMDVRELVARDFKVDIGKFDVLYVRDPYLRGSAEFLPKIVALAKKFETAGKKVVDSTIAGGELGRGKWADYQRLDKAGLQIPETDLLPDYPLPTAHYPLILKWNYGFKAKDVFLIQNQQQLKNILPLHPKKEWLVQEYLRADYEYKIITVGYKALPVILRFKIKDGGFRVDFKSACSVPIHRLSGTPINPPRLALGETGGHATSIVTIAESASKLLGRELAKVDILESRGKFYILEVNRFPGLESFEKLTGYNVFRKFLEYLTKANFM